MDFENIYEGPAVLGKQLEVRWFHNLHPNKEPQIHRMPFMSRSLTYIRSSSRRSSKPNKLLRSRTTSSSSSRRSRRSRSRRRLSSSSTSTDILRSIFRHKPVRFNKALLSSRKRTRSDDNDAPPKQPSCDGSNNSQLEDNCKAFGKQFPAYNPLDERTGFCTPPKPPLDAFALFSQMFFEPTRSRLLSTSSSTIDEEKRVKGDLKKQWESLDATDRLYWKQEESWDQKRHLHEQHIYELASSQNLIGTEPLTMSAWKSVNWSVSAAVAPELLQTSNLGNYQPQKHPPTKVFFHFYYIGEHHKVQVQVEERHDRRCPLCHFNARTDEGLLTHCETTHGDELSFEGGKDNDDNLHIAVRALPSPHLLSFYQAPDHLHNFVFIKSKRRRLSQRKIPLVKKPTQRSIEIDHLARRKMIKQLEATGKTEQISQYHITNKIPVRQYYHSKTMLPMQKDEWDYDSDDHPDDHWLHKVSEEMIDEFNDVSSHEKIFMKLWNRFIKVHITIADKDIPKLCMAFIQEHKVIIKSDGLRDNLLLHLFNLWDQGVVSSLHINQLMKAYDSSDHPKAE